MKKYIKIFLKLLAIVWLSACGSTTIGADRASSIIVKTKQSSLNLRDDALEFDFIIENKYHPDVDVELQNLSIEVKGCEVKESKFSKDNISFSKNNQQLINTQVKFINSCKPSAYIIRGKTLLTLSDEHTEEKFQSKEQKITTSVGYSEIDENSSVTALHTYQFYNIPHEIIIDKANKTYSFKIQLLDLKYRVVSGKNIYVAAYDTSFGELLSYNVLTDRNGFAKFSFLSPDSLEGLTGKSIELVFQNEEGRLEIKESIVLKFINSPTGEHNEDISNVLPRIVIPQNLQNIKLSTNSKTIEISIQVFKDKAPYNRGSIKVELPSKVLKGIDVGLFDDYEVPVNSQGIAVFNYTGPSNLKALVENDDLFTIFKFYHTENSNVEHRKEIRITYEPTSGTYVPINYKLSVKTNSDDFSMGIPNIEKTFSILLKDGDGNIIKDSDIEITKAEVKSENSIIANLVDSETATLVNSLILKNENNSPFILKSDKLSGIVPIRVNVEFKDINKQEKKLSTIVNVRVMSGPPSAISISYVSTEHDRTRAKYKEKFAISVTDEYGNKVNTQPYISVGAIVGYAVDGREISSLETNKTKRLFYSKFDIENSQANGELKSLNDGQNSANFEDNTAERSEVFKWVNIEGSHTDKLVVFGKGKNYEAMGKWDFDKLNNNTLALKDNYFGKDRADLYYAIGHNYYQDQCFEDGREWLGSTDSESYQLDDEGTVVVSYKYDYHLTGKEALVWVNLNGYQADTKKNTRIGEVTKHTLRGRGLSSEPSVGYKILKASSSIVSFNIKHSSVPEWYRNAHFGYAINPNLCANIEVVESSNGYDARSCNHEGIAFVTFKVTASDNEDCSFNIEDILVADEF